MNILQEIRERLAAMEHLETSRPDLTMTVMSVKILQADIKYLLTLLDNKDKQIEELDKENGEYFDRLQDADAQELIDSDQLEEKDTLLDKGAKIVKKSRTVCFTVVEDFARVGKKVPGLPDIILEQTKWLDEVTR